MNADQATRDRLAEGDVQAAIADIEDSRQTHVRWSAYLRRNPDFEPGLVGDIEHHDQVIRKYDNVLTVLRGQGAAVLAGLALADELDLHSESYPARAMYAERIRAALTAPPITEETDR